MTRLISTIASDIRADWAKPNFAAVPYLDAMRTLRDITDQYYCDSASSVVQYFLANSASWRGDVARSIKAELKAMLKG